MMPVAGIVFEKTLNGGRFWSSAISISRKCDSPLASVYRLWTRIDRSSRACFVVARSVTVVSLPPRRGAAQCRHLFHRTRDAAACLVQSAAIAGKHQQAVVAAIGCVLGGTTVRRDEQHELG